MLDPVVDKSIVSGLLSVFGAAYRTCANPLGTRLHPFQVVLRNSMTSCALIGALLIHRRR